MVSSALVASVLAGALQSPAGAVVSTVNGSAFGYYVNVGLFGGPRTLRGAGTAVPSTDVSYSPSVALPPGGSSTTLEAEDLDGAKAVYGPAVIFGGIWPDNVSTAGPSGPLKVTTVGTPSAGSVTSTADVRLYDTPTAASCATGFSGPCTYPGGFGPGPLVGDNAHSTCTADESGVSGSATFANGHIETKYDASTQEPLPAYIVPIPTNPPPNWTVSGSIDHVGDFFTIVLNEQVIGSNSITVNAAHMYLLGATARGDMVVGSSTCSLASDVANGTPVANDDSFGTAEDTPLTIPAASGVLANDTDPDANPLTATNAQAIFVPGPSEPLQSTSTTYTFPSDPPHGNATINADGSFTYTPDANYFGPDSFKYVARDARGAWDDATVTINVSAVADDPVAVDDSDQTVEDTPLSVPAPGVLANDTDGDNDVLTAGSASDPDHGSVVLNSNGSYTYTPDANFLGTDSFTYVVSDGTGRTDTATVTMAVTVDGATLVKDINVTSAGAGSSPGNFKQIGSTVFFSASEDVFGTGIELWKTDGTAAGTVMVKDIRPGTFGDSSPSNLTEFNGTLYFSANSGSSTGQTGTELWTSDGTAAGTVLVKDINTGTSSSSPANLRVVGSTLFFTANGGTGTELWKSDGTPAGTVLVKDINTTTATASSSPANFAIAGSTLYFSANNGVNGIELWKSDGTTAGTVMVKDINTQTATASSSPVQLTVIGSTVFFRATNGTATGVGAGVELWKTDGSDPGTVLVKDINPGTTASTPNNLFAWGSTLLFSATDAENGTELWKSDGTAAGTVMVINNSAVGSSTPGQFRVLGSIVLFSANGGTGAQGFELWKTDGTDTGTVLVKDINPGTANSSPNQLTVVGGVVYFSATTASKGTELWKTDGTAAGTVLVEDVNAGSASASPAGLTPALGTMFFSATDAATGSELWRLADVKLAPVAGDDAYGTVEDTPLVVTAPGVLANDTDGNGDTLTAGSASTPANGSVTLNADGSFTYTPGTNFNGTDSFTYTADDGDGGTDTATVTITVSAADDSPMAVGDSYSTPANTALSVNAPGVLSNDTDPENDSLTAGSAASVVGGSVSLNADGSFTYTPDFGFSGAGGFSYTASDGNGGTANATVTITVAAAGASYLAVNDLSVTEGNTGLAPATEATFTITRSGDTSGSSKVTYATASGTAASPGDFVAVGPSTVTFGPGQTTKTVTVSVNGDTTNEPNEAFSLKLSSPLGAVISDLKGVATIVNDDPVPGPTTFFSVNDVSFNEGSAASPGTTSMVITRSGDTTGTSTVYYATADGTAIAGTDYKKKPLTQVTFAPGDTIKVITVKAIGDSVAEPNETFKLKLSSPTGATISDGTGIATIVNDD
ncbi:MAG TPA: ELWxxDGT repeat protein [Acidimicrobiales bacterium]|nr:ELWxxDGT repeat protein [Acidimicrobiales bacterium]